ncbi:MAG: UDP-N-acetylglucosamine diphosphorylase/glucosamine-1-phosphate N-acetyltransferase [Burkholderiaceae bacterium]|nr:UDP-N-acetylglucosamine diphosphorylase/glucosamine-1-phosphate N-acetyltransferase [Burkholderiaceae bacterium]
MNIVILAAGKGTRMRSALPKVLHPIGGVPMLQHVIKTATTLNPDRIIVVIGHGAEQVKQTMEASRDAKSAPPLHWVLQDPPLGTGHAVAQALPLLNNTAPTLVLYGDVPLIGVNTLCRLIESAENNRGMAILTALLNDPSGYGRIVRDVQGRISRITEEKDADHQIRQIKEINTGFLVVPTDRLSAWIGALDNRNAQGEYYLTDIIAMAVQANQPIGSAQPENTTEILGINSQEQRAMIERHYQRQLANRLMQAGVRLQDPDRIDIRGILSCAADVAIDVGCVFEGTVTLDEGVLIGPHCVIRNARIGTGTVIEAFSHIDGAEVGPKAVIGPYARLRPGTNLGEGAHVGNFVEIKNSTLGSRSKANHLAYLGDATIGARVNVGAGTITCNYDGAAKHRTIIEDDVFIGSDTQLVAPVTVGKGATLGAGTTLTQDAPADQLTLSRARQVSIKGYKRPHKKEH